MDNVQDTRKLPPFTEGALSPETWNDDRRNEILRLFRNEIYGEIPDQESISLSFRTAYEDSSDSVMGGYAVRKTVEVTAERSGNVYSFSFVLFVPKHAAGPVPAVITLCNRGIMDVDPSRAVLSPFWPAETMISRGYAAAALLTHAVAPDYFEGFTMGFHKLYPEYALKRPGSMGGAISAWAWGIGTVVDYLQSDAMIDGKKIAAVGHSRGGKTVLWSAAQDARISVAVSSCSGCTGAALARGKTGERAADIASRFPYWFCENYQKYKNNEDALPVDQHMLLGLIAPRRIYVASRTRDAWADPIGEFESCLRASAIYKLYGKTGLPLSQMPRPDTPVLSGEIGYHIKTGGHDMDEYDWERFLDFFDASFRKEASWP
ncbi:alpha/beta hydrolase [Treponema sp. OttesenSCG-928-L16]|nr:alpha/beta hydrolase [Treponema sp. OttesenSCG-928-L16]